MKLLTASNSLTFHSTKNIQDILVKVFSRNNHDKLISLVADMDETNLKHGNLNVQLGHFSIIVDSKDVSVGNLN